MKFQTNQFFVKSYEEMEKVFGSEPDVLKRTLAIAERCNFKLQQGEQSVSTIRCA